MNEKTIEHMSGKRLIELIDSEIKRHKGTAFETSYRLISKAAGLNEKYIRNLRASDSPNPGSLALRSILFVMGYEVSSPEDDVIPHLKAKGVWSDDQMRRVSRMECRVSEGKQRAG